MDYEVINFMPVELSRVTYNVIYFILMKGRYRSILACLGDSI